MKLLAAILIVEDDEEITELLRFNLKHRGYEVITASDGHRGLELAHTGVDLIILDIMLPGLDGLEICRRLRQDDATADVPVIMLTVKSEEVDIVLGLEHGADDYMTKPFSIRELLSRIKAQLRRRDRGSRDTTEDTLAAGLVRLDLAAYRAYLNDYEIRLTHKEFELLRLLIQHRGQVLTREVLLDRIWGYDNIVDTRTVDVHIRYLRQKIEPTPSSPRFIETVRGVGYRFCDD